MNKTASFLAESVQSFVDNQTIAGAVLLTGAGDGVPRVETLGYADIAAQRPMQPDTLFWIASNSKQITAAALMILVEEGKIALDDPVGKYLPEFVGQMFVEKEDEEHKLLRKPTRPVRVRDLVAHTSGILPWFSDGRLNAGSLRERTMACALTPLRFEPGSQWEYGNGGFEVAGRIVEVVSGEDFASFLQTRLLTPLGMADTTFWPNSEQLSRLATPYTPDPHGPGLLESTLPFTYPLSEMSGSPSPGGGLFSTVGDCFSFCRMIAAGGTFEGKHYLSESAVRIMTTTQTGDLRSAPDNENGYGLGWNTTSRDYGQRWPERIGAVHHGGAHGTNLWIDPPRNLIKLFFIAQAGWRPETDSNGPLTAFWDASEPLGERPE